MSAFSKYFIAFLKDFFANIWAFITGIWDVFAKALFYDVKKYFEDLINASNEFKFLGWLMAFIVMVVMVAFFGFLILRLYQLLRRYIRFARQEIEKETLLEEIAMLNIKTAELVDEKNKILAMKVSNLGVNAGGLGSLPGYGDSNQQADSPEKKKKESTSRFSKLIQVDEKYRTEVTGVYMEPEDMLGLPELVERFIQYSASQLRLYYTSKVIRTFFAGMATSKIIILEGISGTGKTSLPYAMGKFFKNDSNIVSVQPSWRDRAEMIGYLNEFTKKFNETDFLKALYETQYRDDMNFIVLDEMNLARIEYYFAEFLSIMEMPNVEEWKIDIVPDSWDSDPEKLIDGKILVPQNVWFVGTANRDDSTFTITDKVYDRATSIEMNARAEYIDCPFTENINMTYDYLNMMFRQGIESHPISSKNLERLSKVDEFVADNFKITFGNRIMRQIKMFVPAFVACGGEEVDGLDYIVCRKIFRKFESLNITFLKEEIAQLISLLDKLYGKNAFAESIKYLQDLAKNA